MALPNPPERSVFGPSLEPEIPRGKPKLVIAAVVVVGLIVASVLMLSQGDSSASPSSRVADAMALETKGNCVIFTNTWGGNTQEEADARVKTLAGILDKDEEVTNHTERITTTMGPEGKRIYVVVSAAQVCFKAPKS
jgi:uncharacterized membrane protein